MLLTWYFAINFFNQLVDLMVIMFWYYTKHIFMYVNKKAFLVDKSVNEMMSPTYNWLMHV